jgi:uncharacterized protein (TIGR03067 family)
MFMRSVLVVAAGLMVQTFLFSADPEKPKVEGQHQIVAMERDGKQLGEANYNGASFRITGEKVVGQNKDNTEFLNADYTIDVSKTPHTVVLKLNSGSNKGKELLGLIERKDNTIRIILANPGADRPSDFKTKENQTMYTLKVEK